MTTKKTAMKTSTAPGKGKLYGMIKRQSKSYRGRAREHMSLSPITQSYQSLLMCLWTGEVISGKAMWSNRTSGVKVEKVNKDTDKLQ